MNDLLVPAITGAILGLGVFVIIRGFRPDRPTLIGSVQRIDAMRRSADLGGDDREVGNKFEKTVGGALADFYAARGWQQRPIRADLAMLGKSWENHLANKVLTAAVAAMAIPFLFAVMWAVGIRLAPSVPLWVALAAGVLGFFLPDAQVRNEAAERRRDFRHVVGAYLDLVALNLAGGRGVPEALMAACEIGHGWALWRIREALNNARITGLSQWEALGRLGDDVAVEELRDLATALSLVSDDGAKIRASLTSRAGTLRQREMSETEGKAAASSQTMLVAQLVLCAGFFVFLIYPAISRVVGGT